MLCLSRKKPKSDLIRFAWPPQISVNGDLEYPYGCVLASLSLLDEAPRALGGVDLDAGRLL